MEQQFLKINTVSFAKLRFSIGQRHQYFIFDWLKSPEGTAPEVRNAPNRGRRRASAGIKEPEGDEQKYFLVIP